jgi:hypothetical protein
VHPTGFVDPKDPKKKFKFLAPEALRASGGINKIDFRSRLNLKFEI